MFTYNKLILSDAYDNFHLPFNDLSKVFANEINQVANSNPWLWLHKRLQHNDLLGIHLGDYIKFRFAIGDGPELEYTARIHCIYRDANNKWVIDFWCDELLPNKIKWNDRLTSRSGYLSYYYNNGVQQSGFNIPYYSSTIYAYLNALNGRICYSVYYDSNSSSSNNENTQHLFTNEDFTQTGVWNYIPENLKSYIIAKNGYCANKSTVPNSSYIKTYNIAPYVCPTMGVYNLGNLWIPTSYDFYTESNNIIQRAISSYCAYLSYSSNWQTSNNMMLTPLEFLSYYDRLDYLTKYYPEYGRLYDRNNPNINSQYWLADVGNSYYLNVASRNENKGIDILNNVCNYEEKYLPLCFTIG